MEFYQNRESVNQYLKAAEGHSGRALIQRLKPYLFSHSKALELGSGPGSDWEILREICQVTGSDNSTVFLERLQSLYPHGEFLNINAAHFEVKQQFDLIYSNKVLHHLRDEELQSSLESQCSALKSRGLIAHSFWQGEGTDDFEGMFVNYHEAQELELLMQSKFEVLYFEEYAEFEDGDSLFIIARKLQ